MADAGQGTPKIKDVARRAGVSTATVSRALSAPETVRADTRLLVLEAVRELGYAPNAAARNLRAGKAMMALVFVPSLSNPFFAEVLRGINAELSAAGYGMIIGDLDNTVEREAHLVDLAVAGHVDGMIVMSGRMPVSHGRRLSETGLPIVAACAPLDEEGIPTVLCDDRGGAETQVRHLVGLGHRRLMYVSGRRENYNEQRRYEGFRATAAELGLGDSDLVRVEADYSYEAGAAAGDALLALREKARPTGAVSANDAMAIGFMRRVRDGGLTVPGDVSVVGFDGMEFARYCEPVLATMVQPRRDIGTTAARLLLAAMRGAEVPAEPVILPVTLQVGRSTGPAPGGGPARGKFRVATT